MVDWEHLRHFITLAASGSLSAAARRLGVEHATVARRVSALEESLGLKLVDRRGRRLTLSEDGHRIASIVARMEQGALEIARVADGARTELKGDVTVSAPPALAAARMTAPLVALQKQHPQLAIQLVGEVRSASLDRREADIAVRLSRPEGGDLTILKLGEIAFEPFASRAYLRETPKAHWSFIGYDAPMDRSVQQQALEEMTAGRPIAFRTNALEIQIAAVRAGAGVAMLPDFLISLDDEIIHAQPEMPPLLREVWLAVHSDLKNAAPVRAVIEALRAGFTQQSVNLGCFEQ